MVRCLGLSQQCGNSLNLTLVNYCFANKHIAYLWSVGLCFSFIFIFLVFILYFSIIPAHNSSNQTPTHWTVMGLWQIKQTGCASSSSQRKPGVEICTFWSVGCRWRVILFFHWDFIREGHRNLQSKFYVPKFNRGCRRDFSCGCSGGMVWVWCWEW